MEYLTARSRSKEVASTLKVTMLGCCQAGADHGSDPHDLQFDAQRLLQIAAALGDRPSTNGHRPRQRLQVRNVEEDQWADHFGIHAFNTMILEIFALY
jgi:hypothetical protein